MKPFEEKEPSVGKTEARDDDDATREPRSSFWSGTSGAVTAVTGLVGAMAALVGALYQVGVLGDDALKAPPGPTVTEAKFPNEAEAQLLAVVPPGIRTSCARSSTQDVALTAAARVTCAHRAVDYVQYNLYRTPGELVADYERQLRGHRTVGKNGCVRTANVETPYSLDTGTSEVGRLHCYIHEGTAWLEWTNTDLRVYGWARRDDGDMPALYKWWRQAAGPIRAGDA